ncbi:hypothetical protein CQP30_08060 [Yersinia pestis]|uniref:Uncharacterized protein n=4 Tax=Yersinia pseudotuberculosis complex TaxID=1649845 RepID=A0AAX2I4W6_YERPE|nr:hypothetical protein YP_0144 [Yersinia pestis biovar Microtus str. 91001]AIN12726.1 hypothetical protein DJ40_2638 [Yersinia pseudotuberculosis]AJI91474.1 hypothetical protein CH59_2235 [Yersinia pestis]AJI97587.1 hypothetical protein BZ18_490 [Yersinia pestis Pestoides F]AJJ54958.1 hypothetical protein BZ17_2828 [Yersinia pseudotuberculosis IP 32953]AJJ58339.1 hypothetical protein BZ22_768 [Yersinia pseudotuberculosis YPIII]AJJ68796.1 hypothetical protein BZ16_3204 [Yersinia pseudotubercu
MLKTSKLYLTGIAIKVLINAQCDQVLIYPLSLTLQGCWLRVLTRITDLSQLIGIRVLAAYLQSQ